METKENVEVKSQPVVEEAIKESNTTNDSTTEHISVSPDKSEDIIKSQTGQIKKLQAELDELKKKGDVKSVLKELLGTEKVESDVDPIELLKSEVSEMRSKITLSEAEKKRNDYILNLDGVTDTQRKWLINHVPANIENVEDLVKSELESLNAIVQEATPKATDSRPKGIGSTTVNLTDARAVLDHPEVFKK